MCISSEHCLCLPCFFSIERIHCRKIFKKLINFQKKPSEYKKKMGTAFTSWRNKISPSYLALRSELETEAIVHWVYSASSTTWLTQTEELSPAKRVTWVSGWNWEDKRWENHTTSKKWLSGQHFLEHVHGIKKSNFVHVQLRQNTAVKVLLLGRLFFPLPVSWKIQRTLFDETNSFSQNSLIMASMTWLNHVATMAMYHHQIHKNLAYMLS